MVLYLFCWLFFRPAGAKNNQQGMKIRVLIDRVIFGEHAILNVD